MSFRVATAPPSLWPTRVIAVLSAAFLLFAALCVPSTAFGQASRTGSSEVEEYELKAAYLYNFLLLTNWPQEGRLPEGEHVVIGIIGEDPFQDAFRPVERKDVRGRALLIRNFDAAASKEELKSCDLLYVSPSLGTSIKTLLKTLGDEPILTVGEGEQFLEMGGMVRFVITRGKLRFEINRISARNAGISFRAGMLRVAERVVED